MRKRSAAGSPLEAMKKRIVTAAVCAVMALIAWGSIRCNRATPPPAVPRNILLITIDTLRADALGAYGNTRAVTPLIDRLAHGGLRFDNARAHNVVTLPSHANILTGRLPIDHGVRDNSGFRVPANEETLATWLKARGFRTGAFVSAFPLDSRFGLARGFDEYDDRFVDAIARPAMLEQERPGTVTVAAAARWIASQDGKWFCWVHLYEPHFPYAPPAPFDARFAGDGYAGEVAATDEALRPLLQPILDAGSATPTLVVLTSDHGESLGDHGEATHGIFAYDATLKVPLIVYYPPLLKPRTIATPAGHVDIAPTILRALGIESFTGVRGRSLIDDPQREPQDVTYFEALSGSLNRGWAPLTGIVANGMKYVDLPVAELYDLAGDPQERHNLAAERSKEVADLRARLAAYAAGATSRTAEDAETRRRLQSLGYIIVEHIRQCRTALYREGRSEALDQVRNQTAGSRGPVSERTPRGRARPRAGAYGRTATDACGAHPARAARTRSGKRSGSDCGASARAETPSDRSASRGAARRLVDRSGPSRRRDRAAEAVRGAEYG